MIKIQENINVKIEEFQNKNISKVKNFLISRLQIQKPKSNNV